MFSSWNVCSGLVFPKHHPDPVSTGGCLELKLQASSLGLSDSGVRVPRACAVVGQEWNPSLAGAGFWSLTALFYTYSTPSKVKLSLGCFYSSHSLPCSKACDCVTASWSAKKLIFCETLSWLIFLWCCAIARFDARGRKGKRLEATGFGTGSQLAWDSTWSCTLTACAPTCLVIVINSAELVLLRTSRCSHVRIYISKYHVQH